MGTVWTWKPCGSGSPVALACWVTSGHSEGPDSMLDSQSRQLVGTWARPCWGHRGQSRCSGWGSSESGPLQNHSD